MPLLTQGGRHETDKFSQCHGRWNGVRIRRNDAVYLEKQPVDRLYGRTLAQNARLTASETLLKTHALHQSMGFSLSGRYAAAPASRAVCG